MGKPEEEQGVWALRAMGQVLIGGLLAAVVSLVILFLCAVAISQGWLNQGKTGYFTVAACILGSFSGGVVAVSRCKGRSLIVGLLTGVVLFLALLSAGMLIYQNVSLEEGGLPLGCACLCGGALAGITGAGPKKKRRK